MTDEVNADTGQGSVMAATLAAEAQAPAAAAPVFSAAGSMASPSPEALSKLGDLGGVGSGRASAVIAGYEHAMETNSPRTMTELNELKALLLGE